MKIMVANVPIFLYHATNRKIRESDFQQTIKKIIFFFSSAANIAMLY